jgi:hypothetical protein
MERTVLITTSLCKTAHLGRIASHYEFAPHTTREFLVNYESFAAVTEAPEPGTIFLFGIGLMMVPMIRSGLRRPDAMHLRT